MTDICIRPDSTENQRKLMAPYLSELSSNSILVEIGTGCGLSSTRLREMTEAVIYTIDPYPFLVDCPGVIYFRMPSEEAAAKWTSGNIDFLIVDGDHTFNGIVTDIQCWLPKLSSNGIIVFDDYMAATRKGLCSLGVTVCLNALISTGMLLPLKQEYGLLIATATRNTLLQSDLDACLGAYTQLTTTDDYKTQVLNETIPKIYNSFWEIYGSIPDKTDSIVFRKLVDAYRTLQSMDTPNIENLDTGTLHNELIKQQVSMILIGEIGRICGKSFNPPSGN